MTNPHPRLKNSVDFTFADAIDCLCGRNAQAQYVLKLVQNKAAEIDPATDGLLAVSNAFLELDKHALYDANIWRLYENVCNKNLVFFMAILRASQLGLLLWESVTAALEGERLDVEAILRQVQEHVPNFGVASSN